MADTLAQLDAAIDMADRDERQMARLRRERNDLARLNETPAVFEEADFNKLLEAAGALARPRTPVPEPIQAHVPRVQPIVPGLPCESCGKTFSVNSQLNRHRTTVHGPKNSNAVCADKSSGVK